MPGIAAVLAPDPSTRLVPLIASMRHYAWHQAGSIVTRDGRASLGVVTLGPPEKALFETADGDAIALGGELHDRNAGETDAQRLLLGWQTDRERAFDNLHGTFSAVIWDRAAAELTVITDRFGMRPVYVAEAGGRVLVASEIKAILSDSDVDRRWSDRGVADFFAFGHFFGDRTLFAAVRAVPPATCLTWSGNEQKWTEHRYWRPRPQVVRDPAHVRRQEEALEEGLTRAVARRAGPSERLGLSLSGGLDARTLLALKPSGVPMTTVSLGIEGSIDHRGASRLAELAGVTHHRQILDASFLGDFERHLREMLHITDGHYLDQGIVMSTLPAYRDLEIDFLLRGHGGELLHMRKAYAYSLSDSALRLSAPDLQSWLFDRLTAYMLEGLPENVFSFDVREMARASLVEALNDIGQVERPIDAVWPLFLNERLHRETALSMHLFNAFATVRMPFIDNDVVDAILGLPAEHKLGDALQTTVLARRRPDFLSVVNSNTGVRMGASPLATKIGSLRMRVYAKLGVKGYQPYERLGLWLRRELRPLVGSLLLGDDFLGQGLFSADGVRAMIAQHETGRTNHTFQIMAMMIFELGRRNRGRPA